MKEDKSKVEPMMEPESDDPYVFDTTTQEFIKIELTEKQLDKFMDMPENPPKDVIDRFEEFMKSPEFLETLKRVEKKGLNNESI